MIVCHCRAVTDREVVAVAEAGACDIAEVADACGAGSECHGCHNRIDSILEKMELLASDDRRVLQEAS